MVMAFDLAIDVGTENVVVAARGEGVVLREPAVVAVDASEGLPVEIGSEALKMIESFPGSLAGYRPMAMGTVKDVKALAWMAGIVLRKCGASKFSHPDVLICCRPASSSIERRAVQDAFRSSGAAGVGFLPNCVGTAAAAGIAVSDPTGVLVLDMGAGQSCASVVSLGTVAAHDEVSVGGDGIDSAIKDLLRHSYGVVVSSRVAEEVKLALGQAGTGDGRRRPAVEVTGRDISRGEPVSVVVTAADVWAAAEEAVLMPAVEMIKRCLGALTPELAFDVAGRGALFAGGTSKLAGLAVRLEEELGLEVSVMSDPQLVAVTGAGSLIGSRGRERRLLDEIVSLYAP